MTETRSADTVHREIGHCQIKSPWSSFLVPSLGLQGVNLRFVWLRPDRRGRQSWLNNGKSLADNFCLTMPFAGFLEDCPDVVSYAKNYLAVHFKLDYVNADGNISNYYPDFLVKLNKNRIVIVETKGQETLTYRSRRSASNSGAKTSTECSRTWFTISSLSMKRALKTTGQNIFPILSPLSASTRRNEPR